MSETSQKRRRRERPEHALVLADEPMRRIQWHRVPFAPDELHGVWRGLSRGCYETVCGRQIDRDDVRDIEYEPWSKVVAPRDSCGACRPEPDYGDIATDGGRAPRHGREYRAQQARDHRAMERRNRRRDGFTSGGRRL